MNEIATAITDMEQTIAARSMMLQSDYELEFVGDMVIGVKSVDPITFEYAYRDSNRIFKTNNRYEFVEALAVELLQ